MPPITVARPSARSARAMSARPIRFSTISPVAKTSPVVSTAVINMTTIMDRTAASANLGAPKEKGVVTPSQGDVVTAAK